MTEDSRLIAAYPMGRGFELDLAGLPGELTTLRCDILDKRRRRGRVVPDRGRINGMKPYMPAGMPPSPGKRYHLDGTAPFGRMVVPSCLDSEGLRPLLSRISRR